MKPRIVLSQKVWMCFLPDFRATRRVGFGYSPAEAFEDWRAQCTV